MVLEGQGSRNFCPSLSLSLSPSPSVCLPVCVFLIANTSFSPCLDLLLSFTFCISLVPISFFVFLSLSQSFSPLLSLFPLVIFPSTSLFLLLVLFLLPPILPLLLSLSLFPLSSFHRLSVFLPQTSQGISISKFPRMQSVLGEGAFRAL